jgi:hypothetical protein
MKAQKSSSSIKNENKKHAKVQNFMQIATNILSLQALILY